MNTDEHRLLKTGTGEAWTCVVRNLCLSVFICGSKLWQFLRAVFEDDAYDRYLTRAPRVTLSAAERQRGEVEGSAALSPAQFYLLRLANKYSRPNRCC